MKLRRPDAVRAGGVVVPPDHGAGSDLQFSQRRRFPHSNAVSLRRGEIVVAAMVSHPRVRTGIDRIGECAGCLSRGSVRHRNRTNEPLCVVLHRIDADLPGAAIGAVSRLVLPPMVDDPPFAVERTADEGVMSRALARGVADQDRAPVGPRSRGRVGGGVVDGIGRIPPTAVAVGEIVSPVAEMHEDALGELGRGLDGNLTGDADQVRIQLENTQLRSRAASRIEVDLSGFRIGERHRVDRLEAVASCQQRPARVVERPLRPIADRDANPRGRQVLRADGIVEIVPAAADQHGRSPGMVPLLAVIFDPGHIREVQHRAVALPVREARRGEREKTLPPAVAPRGVHPDGVAQHDRMRVGPPHDRIGGAENLGTEQAKQSRDLYAQSEHDSARTSDFEEPRGFGRPQCIGIHPLSTRTAQVLQGPGTPKRPVLAVLD